MKPANFEDAITATEFGKFNIFLILVTVLPCFSQTFESGAMSFVVPVAQCDLKLSLEDKGLLNAIIFAGNCHLFHTNVLRNNNLVLYKVLQEELV